MGLAEFDRKQNRNRRKRAIRKRTESIRKITRAYNVDRKLSLLPVLDEFDRPQTRADCARVQRPCPFVACKWNMYLDVTRVGSIQFNFPDLDPDQMPAASSCVLDVADRGGVTLEKVGEVMNLTRERVRQLEESASPGLKAGLLEWEEDESAHVKTKSEPPTSSVAEIDYLAEQPKTRKSRANLGCGSYSDEFSSEAPNATLRTMVAREYARRYGGDAYMPYWSHTDERELRTWLESPWAERVVKGLVRARDHGEGEKPVTTITEEKTMPEAKRPRGQLQQQILRLLQEDTYEPVSLARRLVTTVDNVRHALHRLQNAGLIQRMASGRWTIGSSKKKEESKPKTKRARSASNGQTTTTLHDAVVVLRERRKACEDEIRRIDSALKKLETY